MKIVKVLWWMEFSSSFRRGRRVFSKYKLLGYESCQQVNKYLKYSIRTLSLWENYSTVSMMIVKIWQKRRSHVFYNFYENGELHSDDEDSNQSENEELEDSPYEEYSEDHSTNSMDINESEDVAELDHEFNTIPRYGVHKISIWYNLTISQRKLILIFIMRPFQYPLDLVHLIKINYHYLNMASKY